MGRRTRRIEKLMKRNKQTAALSSALREERRTSQLLSQQTQESFHAHSEEIKPQEAHNLLVVPTSRKKNKISKKQHGSARLSRAENTHTPLLKRRRKFSDPEPAEGWPKAASEHFPTLVTPINEFLGKQTFTANEIVTWIFSGKEFKCTCDHYLIGASSFYSMLNMQVTFDKQHKKFGYYDSHHLPKSVEATYATHVTPMAHTTRRSNRYPFLCATPDIIHSRKGKVYYDEIKSSTSKNFSSFWNQRNLFQLYIASLLHRADHYRFIGIFTEQAQDGILPDQMQIACCIEVVFKYDILATELIQQRMSLGYFSYLKIYFFTTGVAVDATLFDHMQKELLARKAKPHTSFPVEDKPMKNACKYYLMAFDAGPKLDKLEDFDSVLPHRVRKRLYNQSKSQLRFSHSLSLDFYQQKNHKNMLESHPFRRIDMDYNYELEPKILKVLPSQVTKVTITVDQNNWNMFFDHFVPWQGLEDLFPVTISTLNAIGDL